MSHAIPPRTLDEIRAENERHYGPSHEARAYAEDHGAVFCERCHVVFEPAPENAHLGHDCPVITRG